MLKKNVLVLHVIICFITPQWTPCNSITWNKSELISYDIIPWSVLNHLSLGHCCYVTPITGTKESVEGHKRLPSVFVMERKFSEKSQSVE